MKKELKLKPINPAIIIENGEAMIILPKEVKKIDIFKQNKNKLPKICTLEI